MPEIKKLIEELERTTGKKVIFTEDLDSVNLDIQRAVKSMATPLIDTIKGKAAFYAKKHGIRVDVVETMFKNDFIKYLNSRL